MAPLPVGQMFQVNIYIKADHRNRSYDDHQYIHDDFSDSAGLLLKHTPKTNNMIARIANTFFFTFFLLSSNLQLL